MEPARGAGAFQYLDAAVLQKIGALEVIAREVVEGVRVGMHRSRLRGFSTDFAHHRQYVMGDPIRHIDWRVWGRTERYYVKLYEADTNYEAYLLMDASASMSYASGKVSKGEYAKFLAASLAYLILQQRDSVGLAVFDAALQSFSPPRGSLGVIRQLEEMLRRAEPRPRTNVARQLHDLAERMPRRGLVFLFSDLFDDLPGFLSGLDHLRFRGHDVTVLHVLDPYELEFPFTGPWKFLGLEDEPELTTQPERIRTQYLAEIRKFLDEVRTGCERSQVDYLLVSTARPLDVVLAEYLVRRFYLAGAARSEV